MRWQSYVVLTLLACSQAGNGFLFDDFGGGGGFDFGDITSNIGDFVDNLDLSMVTKTVQKHLMNLNKNVQSAFSSAADLIKLSSSDLLSIPTDVFGSLSSSLLSNFNSSTVKILARKFTTASTSVVTHFFSNIPSQSFIASLSSLQNLNFQRSQLNGIVKAYKNVVGDVSTWTKKAFSDLGKFAKGLTSTDLGKISKNIFDDVLADLPLDSFSWSQAQGMFKSAKNAWGDFSSWTADQLMKLKNVAANLPSSNILKLSSSAISGVVSDWNSRTGWSRLQKGAIAEKLKSSWGGFSSWSADYLKKAANLIDGLNVQDFSQLNFSSLISSSALADVAANPWLNSKQLGVLVSKLKMSWGPIQRWTAQQIRKAGRSLKVLLPRELLMLNVSAIVDQFDSLANDCGFSFSQTNVLLTRFFDAARSGDVSLPLGQMSAWTGRSLDKLSCLARGFVCGEFRNLKDGVVRSASKVISNSDWSRPQLRLLVKKFGQVDDLSDLKGLVGGISRDAIRSLGWSKTNVTKLVPGALKQFGNAQLMALAEAGLNWIQDAGDSGSEDFWSADKIRTYGDVLRGFSREDMASNVPQEFFTDFVNALSDISDVTERQVKTAIDGFKAYHNITKSSDLSKLTAIDIAEIGPISISLDVDELKALTPEACQEVLVQIGQAGDNFHKWASETKLISVAKWAIQCLKAVDSSSQSVLSSDHVALLGHLIEFLDDDTLNLIDQDAVKDSFPEWGSFSDADEHAVEKFAFLVKKHLKLNSLTVQDVVRLGNIIKGFDLSDLASIPDEAIASAVSEIGEILSLDGERAEALIAKIKKVWGSDISKWSASQLKNLGRLFGGLTSDEIESIAEDAFDDVVDLLGELDLSRDQLQAGINLAKKVWGDLKAAAPQNLKRLGNLLTSLSADDVADVINKTLSCDDSLYSLSQIKSWTSDQADKVVQKAKMQFGSASSWSGDFLNNLGSFAKSLSVSDLSQGLSSSALDEGAGLLGSLDLLPAKKKAVVDRLLSGVSDIQRLERSRINELGDLLGGLRASDVQSLTTDQIDAIDADTFPRLDDFVKFMSVDQLKTLGADQARSVSAAQVSGLSAEQCVALKESAGDSTNTCSVSPTGGAGINVATSFGLVALMAPLIF